MNSKYCLILIVLLILLAGCGQERTDKNSGKIQEPEGSPVSGKITISGAYALSPLLNRWAESFMKLHPEVKIQVIESGTGPGIEALFARQADLAMISRPLTEEEGDAGIWIIPVAKDGVAPIVNRKNPYLHRLLNQGLSPDEFQKIFTSGESIKWGDLLDTAGSEKVVVLFREEESGASAMLTKFLFRQPADLRGTRVNGDIEMIKGIQSNPLAIGYCNFSYAFDSENGERTEDIQIIPFDLDFDNDVDRKEVPFRNIEEAHRSVWLGIYPDNLCRDLTLGSLGKPSDPLVTGFIRYILSEGQEEVKDAGLCKLNNIYIRRSLELLD